MRGYSFQTGSKVIATYGRYDPETGREWTGVVLNRDDPQAWINTIAFPGPEEPDKKAVKAHVERHQDLLSDRVPVAWEFGKVYWERPWNLKTV